MYVCLCKGVTDRVVRRTIQAGARTEDEVGRRCGAGTCCGSCRPHIRRLLVEEADTRAAEVDALAAK